jgi:prepilin-type N-terminal cleavage/methylation domain-containing protein
MINRKGFTLIETLFSTLILVIGLVAVAKAFSYGIQAGERVRQQTSATALLTTKLEELKTAEDLQAGQYTESLGTEYQRTWEITAETPRRITVILYTRQPSRRGSFREVARLSTSLGPRF